MNQIENLLKEAKLMEDELDDFLRFSKGGRRQKPRPQSDQELADEVLKCIAGDVIEVNKKKYVLVSRPSQAPRSRNIEAKIVPFEKLKAALGGDQKTHYTLTLRAVQEFKKLGNLKPEQLKMLQGKSEEINKTNMERTSANLNTHEWIDGQYQVKMLDGNFAKVGDTVMVRFSNADAPMRITKVGGTQNGEVMMISPRKPIGSKSRGIPPKLIMKKV